MMERWGSLLSRHRSYYDISPGQSMLSMPNKTLLRMTQYHLYSTCIYFARHNLRISPVKSMFSTISRFFLSLLLYCYAYLCMIIRYLFVAGDLGKLLGETEELHSENCLKTLIVSKRAILS